MPWEEEGLARAESHSDQVKHRAASWIDTRGTGRTSDDITLSETAYLKGRWPALFLHRGSNPTRIGGSALKTPDVESLDIDRESGVYN